MPSEILVYASYIVHRVLHSLSSCYSLSPCCFKFRGRDQGSGSGCATPWQATSAECHMNMEHGGQIGTHQAPGRLAKQADYIWYAPPSSTSGRRSQRLSLTNLPQSLRSDKLGLDCCERSALSCSRGGARSHCSGLI